MKTMQAAILKLVQERGDVSFAELEKLVPGFSGDFEMVLPSYSGIVLWPCVSEEGIGALGDLLNRQLVGMKKVSQILYFSEQRRPALPAANSVRDYKHPRWLPVVFCQLAQRLHGKKSDI